MIKKFTFLLAFVMMLATVTSVNAQCSITIDTVDITAPSCLGNTDGMIVVNATIVNPVGTVLYALNGTAGGTSQPFQASSTFTGLTPGTYEAIVVDDIVPGPITCADNSLGNVMGAGVDVTPPTITPLSGTTFNVDLPADCLYTVPDGSGLFTITDNCDPTPVYSQNPAAGFIIGSGAGTYSVIVTGTDASGNFFDTNISLILSDVTAPVIICPANTTQDADASCNISLLDYTGSATTGDSCDAAPVVTQSPVAGTIINGAGTVQTVTLTSTDASGNFSTCTFDVTVVDVTPPSIVCPANISVNNDSGLCGAVATWLNTDISASDNCGISTITQTTGQASGTLFPVGTTTNTFVVVDNAGLSATCSFDVIVTDTEPPVDTTPPGTMIPAVLDATGSITLGINAADAIVTGTDNCITIGNNRIIILGNAAARTFTCADLGTNPTVQVRLRDNTPSPPNPTGTPPNDTVITVGVDLQDNEFPIITTPAANLTVECDGAGNTAALLNWVTTLGGAVATDNCGVSWTSDFTGLSNDCGATGFATVTFTAEDSSGNSVDTIATFTIADITAPSMDTDASGSTVECDGAGNAAELNAWLASNGGAVASDVCGGVTWSNDFTALSDECGATGSATVIFTATDDCGNATDTSAVTFTIADITAPSMDTDASGSTVECDGAGNAAELNAWLASNGGAVASDVCGGVTWSNDFTALSDECGATGSATVIFTATDDCGNATDTSAVTFTIEDTTVPTIDTAASDSTVECDGDGNIADFTAWITSIGTTGAASDDCAGISWTNDSSVSGSNATAVPFIDNSTVSSTVPISGIPVGAPIVDIEIDFAINHTWVGDLAIEIVAPTGDAITVMNRPGFTGTGFGNNADLVSSSPITFRDTSSNDPELMGASGNIICQQDGLCDYFPNADDGGASTSSMAFFAQAITASGLDPNGTWTINILDGAGGDTGDFTIPELRVTYQNLSDECGATGSQTVIFTATDECGLASTTTATFTIEDTTDPTIDTVAVDETVECDGAGNTAELNAWLASNGGAAASDLCGGVMWSNDFTALSDECGATGSALVTFTATDDCLNTSTTTATFTIEDTTAPSLDAAASDSTVECDGSGNTAELNAWLASNGTTGAASDDCSGVTWTNDFTALSDDCGATGSALVIFTATDDCGLFVTTSATFTIEDTTAPTIDTAAADETVECDGAGNTAELNAWLASNGGAIASDDCSGVAWSNDFTALSDDCGATGSALVTFTATDECGLASTTSATFTIEDTTDPSIDTAAADETVECDGAGNTAELNAWLASNGGAIASDLCSGVVWSNDFTALSDDCGATGAATVTFTATDDCLNFSTTTATFTIEDTTPAIIACPGDVTATTEDGDCGAIVNFQNAGAFEDCGDVFVYQTEGLGSGSVFPIGDTLIEFTAQDECGNLSTCTFTVTVIDDDAPNAVCQNITVQLDDMGSVTITADQINFGSSDNCGVDTLEIDIDTFDCSNVGENTVILTVTDVNGNASTCTSTVTVEDVTAPEITCNDITVELGADGTVTIDPMDIAAGSSDACGIATYELNIDTFTCIDVGNSTVILTVTDVNGNQSSCSATVTVEDNIAPELVCMDVTLELNEDGIAYIIPSQLVDTINDPCGVLVFTADVDEVTCADIGTPVTVNIFANDGNGNSSFCSSTVTVVDVLGPQIVCPPNETVNLDPNGTYTLGDYIGDGIATVSDNCTDPVTIFTQDPIAGTILGFGVNVITFTAEDEYGNVSTCSFELDVEEILGANDSQDFASLVLYPNPADSKVHLSNPRQIDLSDVTVYDLTGRVVNKVDLSNMGSEITIDVSTLANATYMLVIKGSQGTSTKQLIVNNY